MSARWLSKMSQNRERILARVVRPTYSRHARCAVRALIKRLIDYRWRRQLELERRRCHPLEKSFAWSAQLRRGCRQRRMFR